MQRLIASLAVVAGLCAGAIGGDVLHSTQQVMDSYDGADFNCILGGVHAQVADDFVVPSGEVWSIEQVVVDYLTFSFVMPGGALVEVFGDAGGKPAEVPMVSLVASDISAQRFTDAVFGLEGLRLTAVLPAAPVEIPSGHYWVTMQPVGADVFYSIRDSGLDLGNDVHARDVLGDTYGHTAWEPLGGSMSVALLGTASGCVADFNGDGTVNTLDVLAFLNAWNAQDPAADVNGDGSINTLDVLAFLNLWNAGC